ELIRRLCDETGCSFVVVTHDLGVAAQIADRIAVLYGGRLAEGGAADDVLRRPAPPYSAGLLASRVTMASRPSGPLDALGGEPPDPRDPPPGCPFAPRCAHRTDECAQAVPVLVPAGRHDGQAACIHLDAVAADASTEDGTASARDEVAVWPPTFILRRVDG